jgi:putative FmdB family regulatory protein
MPIYEYRCNACSKTFEKMQKFSDPPLTVCECGEKGQVERVLSPPAFHLKGGGWYKDGYGGAKPAANGDSAKTETKPAETKTESKTADAKPSAPAPASATKSE